MNPSNQSQNPSTMALPPLPDLSSAGTPGSSPKEDAMAQILSGIAPVKQGVDSILAACKQIVQSGAIPGAEQPVSQIVALATSLLPMAAQAALSPGGGGDGSIPPVGGGQQQPQQAAPGAIQ